MAIGELATRDFIRSELNRLTGDDGEESEKREKKGKKRRDAAQPVPADPAG